MFSTLEFKLDDLFVISILKCFVLSEERLVTFGNLTVHHINFLNMSVAHFTYTAVAHVPNCGIQQDLCFYFTKSVTLTQQYTYKFQLVDYYLSRYALYTREHQEVYDIISH